MARTIRYLPPPSKLVEITVKTIQGRFLLKPTAGFRKIVIGALARAQSLYPLHIHALVCLSNHFHLLLSPQDSQQLAAFMRHFDTNLSKEAARLHGWSGTLFHRRYDSTPISSEEAAQINRLRYILSHGCKENLVAKPTDWPGAHCAQALSEGKSLSGIWFNRTAEYEARRQGKTFQTEEFAEYYQLELTPLPCWKHLSAKTVQTHVAEIVSQIELETQNRHGQEGTRPLGRRAILKTDPHHRPRQTKKTPAPRFHAYLREVRHQLERGYAAFVESFREAAQRLKRGEHPCGFPEGSFPPAGPFSMPEPVPG